MLNTNTKTMMTGLIGLLTFATTTNAYPQPAEELAVSNDSFELEKRSSNDILFWERATPACSQPGCYRRLYVFATYTGMDVCQVGAQVGDYDYKSACNTAWEMYGNWYWMGECDGSIKDWRAVNPGTFVGNLYTWNNKYLGPCSATSHSSKGTCDGTAHSLVRCALP